MINKSDMANDNPKLRKNGGKGTFFGNLLRGAVKLGKELSPGLKALIDTASGEADIEDIRDALGREPFTPEELAFMLKQLEIDAIEMQEITKRWEADMSSESWLPKNVRPMTLILYNVACILFIALDSYLESFEVRDMWMNLLLSNTGIVNSAYFGSRYLEKRDSKKYGV